MDASTVNETTFMLTVAPNAAPVPGAVVYGAATATFWPGARLQDNSVYTATVSRGCRNTFGIELRTPFVWTFTTGDSVAPAQPVDLGTAGTFAVLAKAAISTVPPSAITGDMGISPAAATFITGFALTMDATNTFSSSTQVTGKVYAADYAVPTPANLTTAVLDMQTAYNDARARPASVSELGAGNIGGLTIAPGVYKWGTGVQIPTDVTLNGSATDVWIFQIAQDLVMSSATNVVLAGGALPKNVFWQVTGLVTVGTTAHFNGVVLTATAVTLQTGSVVNGRLLAQTAVSIGASTIVQPAP
jgi:hypothetical protein